MVIKSSLEVLCMYLIIFIPFIGLLLIGQPVAFFVYGVTVTAGSFLSCLIGTIRTDLAERKSLRKEKKKN